MLLLALLFASPTQALRPNVSLHPDPCRVHRVSAKDFRDLADRVWSLQRWEREKPKAATIAVAHQEIACARGSGLRGQLKQRWRESQRAFYEHRRQMLWRERVKPFIYPDGSRWAVPYPIAWCESGGDYFVGPSGAYGLIPPFPQYLSPRRQDEIAHRLFQQYGESPWAPYEGECAYR